MNIVPDAAKFWRNAPSHLGPDKCWPWQGAQTDKGYGLCMTQFGYRPAHRVAWELFHGVAAPVHLLACHECDWPPCVNPHHIWLGTAADNAQDAGRKGMARVHQYLHTLWLNSEAGSKRRWLTSEHVQIAKAEVAKMLERRRRRTGFPKWVSGDFYYGIWSEDPAGVQRNPLMCIGARRSLVGEPLAVLYQCRRSPASGLLCDQHSKLVTYKAFEKKFVRRMQKHSATLETKMLPAPTE